MKLEPLQNVDRIAVLGISGTGKSNAAKSYVAAELKRGHRVIAFDPEDEWSRRGRQSPHVKLGPLRERVTFAELGLDPRGYLGPENLSLAIVPSDDQDEMADEFAALVDWCQSVGDVFVVVEEVGTFSRDSREAQKALIKLATRGRHWGCPCLFVSQRAIDVPLGARSQLTQMLSFTQTQPEDLDALAKRVNQEFAERVAHLPLGESLHWCALNRKEKAS